jgi:PAS domain S-box-containing protein
MTNSSPIEWQSENTRLRRSLELFNACNRAIIRAETEVSLLQIICHLMRDQGGYQLAWVGYVGDNSAQTAQSIVHAGQSADRGLIQSIVADTDFWQCLIGQTLRSGELYLVQDIDHEAASWAQILRQSGYQALISLPLIEQNHVFGTLNLYAGTAHYFHAEEVQLLSQLAADLSYGVTKLRADEVRLQTEQALQQSYVQYDNLVNRIPIGVYKFRMSADGAMDFLYVSPRWAEMNQLDPAAVIADPSLAFDLVHPDELGAFVQLNQQARDRLHQFVWEGRVIIGGEVCWWHIESAPTQQANGDIIWDGIQYDITEVIHAKQEQERLLAETIAARTEATNARDLLSSVFNRVNDGIVALDNNWCYTYINNRAEVLIGRPAAELIGKYIWTEFPESVGKPFYHAYYQASEQQKVISLEEYYEPWNRWFENRIYPDSQGLTIYFTETTDRKVATLAIAESEQRYASLAAAVPVGIFRTDAIGNCLYVNDRWSQISGLAMVEAMGTGWVNGLHPDDRELIQAEWYRAAQEQRPFQLEYRFQRADGQVSWVYGQAAAELNEQGEVLGYVGTITDISDRKAAEAERLQAERVQQELNLLEDIFDIVMAGYWEWDIPRHRHYMSYGWKRMLGYEADELPTRPETWQELISPEDLPVVMHHFEQHVQSRGQIPYYNEVRYRHKDGSIVWLICSGQVIEWDDHGNPLRMIGCHIDISDRKAAEQALAQYAHQVEDLYNNAPCGYHSLDPAGIFLRVNDTELQWLGYDREEMLGQPLTNFFTAASRQAFQENYQVFQAQGWVKNLEYEMICKDGSILPVLISAREFRDNDGNYLYNRATLLDIRDRKAVESQIQQLNQELQRSNQDLEQFAYIASHDLQEPLRAIISYTQILMQNYGAVLREPRAQESLLFIIDGGQRMRQLIQDLLAYSRIGSQTLDRQAVDLNHLLAEVLQNLQVQITESQALITSDQLPILYGDRTQFSQLLQNLISNALKFRRAIPPQIHIGIMTLESSLETSSRKRLNIGQNVIFVRDNGIGIKPQYLDQIFDIFRRLHTRHQFPGTGIGLAICKKIVERHGGEIWVTSEWEEGSTFFFTLSISFGL